MKKLLSSLLLASLCGIAFAEEVQQPVREVEEEAKHCESWKKERGNKYAKVPGSRLVCADKKDSE